MRDVSPVAGFEAAVKKELMKLETECAAEVYGLVRQLQKGQDPDQEEYFLTHEGRFDCFRMYLPTRPKYRLLIALNDQIDSRVYVLGAFLNRQGSHDAAKNRIAEHLDQVLKNGGKA